MSRVFVYGSLLAGQGNHSVLAGGRLCGPARTSATYTMRDLGAYPAVEAGGSTAIRGEVYEIDDTILARLDRLEGHPEYYRRVEVDLPGVGGTWIYLLAAAGRPLIESGDWRQHRTRSGACAG